MNIDAESPPSSGSTSNDLNVIVACRKACPCLPLPANALHQKLIVGLAAILSIAICILVPSLIILLILFPICWLCYIILQWSLTRLIKPFLPPTPPPTYKHPIISLYYLTFLLSFVCMLKERNFPRAHNNVGAFDFIFYNSLGSYIIMITCVWIVEVVDMLHVRFTNLTLTFEARRSRNQKLAVIMWALTAIGFVQSAVICYSEPAVIHVGLPVTSLPQCMSGYKIGIISDIHIGALVDRKENEMALRIAVDEEGCDALAIVGDFGDQAITEGVRDSIEPYKLHAAGESSDVPLIWTNGNHENMRGIESWRTLITESGIINVENGHYVHRKGCGEVAYVGLADASGDRSSSMSDAPEKEGIKSPDLEGTMKGLSEELGVEIGVGDSVTTILLAHTPVGFADNAKAGSDVMMSGHTHGGHVFPFHMFLAGYDGASGLFEKTVEDERSWLYVSEGVVGWGPRVRLFSRPEITIVTLLSDEEGGREPEGDTQYRVGQAFVWISLATVPASVLFCLARCIREKRAGGKES